jgi:UDP-glucose 4-epimerase
MKVLVTGCSGFIGQHLVRHLAMHGHDIVGLDPRPFPHRKIPNFKTIRTNVSRKKLMQLPCRPDWIFHCAGGGSVGFAEAHPEEDFRMNVGTAMEILAYARNLKPPPRVIYLSSAAVYGNLASRPISERAPTRPCSSYGFHKLLAEETFRYYSLRWEIPCVVTRLFSVYGEGLKKQIFWDAAQKLQKGDRVFAGTGAETRDFIHVEDVCRLLLLGPKIADIPAVVINCGQGKAVRIRDAIGGLAACLRIPGPRFGGNRRPGDPRHLVANPRRALQIGWKPRINFAEGLRRYVTWVESL